MKNIILVLFAGILALGACATSADMLTPLHVAAERGDIDAIKKLIKVEYPLDSRYNDYSISLHGSRIRNKTALMFAAERGHFEAVKLLLDAGADPYVIESSTFGDDRGNAFDIALMKGHGKIAMLLWERSDKKTFARDLNGSFSHAFQNSCRGFPSNGQLELIKFFLASFDKKYASHALANISYSLECESLIRFVLDSGVSAAPTALVQAAYSGQEELVLLYLRRGVSADSQASERDISRFYFKHKSTALIAATDQLQIGIMRMLLDSGANPNLQDAYGRTALIAIVTGRICSQVYANCEKEIEGIKLLLNKGARVDIRDDQNKAAIDYIRDNDYYRATKRALLQMNR